MQQSSSIAFHEAAPNHGAQTSYNYGHITNHFDVPSGSPNRSIKSHPQPTILVPFRRDPDFVERDVLSGIYERCLQPAGRTALVGLGGVGKSQLAVECAYRIWDTDHEMWVFWVYASNATRFQDSYKRIAEALRLPGFDSPGTDILHIVHRWLSEDNSVRWFMIIDNADDARVLFEPLDAERSLHRTDYSPSLCDFIPQSRNGSVLITSRTVDVAFRLTGRHADIVAVEPMDVAAATAMMEKRLRPEHIGHADKDRTLHRLAQRLDYMPLAISQAVAYIVQRAPRVTVLIYVDFLKKDTSVQLKLLQHDLGDPRRDSRVSNSIILTWHVSFNHIQTLNKPAAQLLALMSQFDRDNIFASLLLPERTSNDIAKLEFEDSLDLLRSFHLIQCVDDGQSFTMHRLVHLSTQQWIEKSGELEKYQKLFIRNLNASTPFPCYHWDSLKLTPHVQKLLDIHPPDRTSQLRRARVLLSLVEPLVWGRVKLAEYMIRESRSAYASYLGPLAAESLLSSHLMVGCLHRWGRLKEAESTCREALDSVRIALEPFIAEESSSPPRLIRNEIPDGIADFLESHNLTITSSRRLGGVSNFGFPYLSFVRGYLMGLWSYIKDYRLLLRVLETVFETHLTAIVSELSDAEVSNQKEPNDQTANST